MSPAGGFDLNSNPFHNPQITNPASMNPRRSDPSCRTDLTGKPTQRRHGKPGKARRGRVYLVNACCNDQEPRRLETLLSMSQTPMNLGIVIVITCPTARCGLFLCLFCI